MIARPFTLKALGTLVGWMLLTFLAAGLGALASIHAADFYARLNKPAWAPPAGVFGPVWTVLYALMGVAVWLVWRASAPRRTAVVLFLVQLAANAAWSWLFFAWHLGIWAALEVVLLLVLIAATVAAFWRSSRVAALLLLPYLCWVTFATFLTWSVWSLNPALL